MSYPSNLGLQTLGFEAVRREVEIVVQWQPTYWVYSSDPYFNLAATVPTWQFICELGYLM